MELFFLIFGATGDIHKKKIYYSLFNFWKNKINEKMKLLCISRKHYTQNDFKQYVKDILNIMNNDLLKFFKYNDINELNNDINKFTDNIIFIKGNYDDINTCIKIKKTIYENSINPSIISYHGVPDFISIQISENLFKIFQYDNIKILLEKPIGVDLDKYRIYKDILNKYDINKFYFIDHYLNKQKLSLFNTVENLSSYINQYYEIEINILENNDIDNRLEYFLSQGLLNDMFQSHINSILKILFGNIIFTDNFELINVVVGQYESDNITDPNIDTYFKIIYKYNDLKIIINCGKKMKIKEKNIIFKIKKNNYGNVNEEKLINSVIDIDDNDIADNDNNINDSSNIENTYTNEDNTNIDDVNILNNLCLKNIMDTNIHYVYNFEHDYGYLTDYYHIFLDCYNNNKNNFISTENMELYWQNVNNIKTYIKNNNIKPFIY